MCFCKIYLLYLGFWYEYGGLQMRGPRQKVVGIGCYYHIVNHTCGPKGSLPISEIEKEFAFDLLKKLEKLFFVEIIATCWMGNHFHIVVYFPGEADSLETVIERYNKFHKDDPYNHPCLNLEKHTEKCQKVAKNLIDLSEFMRSFKQRFTHWYNKLHDRQGALWRGRFWSCILEGPVALWDCVKYVELNPVRAGMVQEPGEYFFSSWGKKCINGVHPFEDYFYKHMTINAGIRSMQNGCEITQFDHIFELFSQEINEILLKEGRLSESEKHNVLRTANVRGEVPFNRYLLKIQNWTRGMIIGSCDFVEETASGFHSNDKIKRKKGVVGRSFSGDRLLSYHKGRIPSLET
jgi:putative transposase